MTNGIIPEDSKEKLKDSLNNEEYSIISENENPTINFKFKLIEFFAKNKLIVTSQV